MGIIARQGGKSTIVLFFGVILGYISNLVVFPYCLSPDEIGIYRILLSAATLIAAFIPLGSSGGLGKYYPFYKNKNNGHNGLFALVLRQTLVGFLVAFTISISLSEVWQQFYGRQATYIEGFGYHVSFLMFCMALINLTTEYSKTLHRISVPFFFKQVIQKSLIIILVLVYFLKYITFNQFILILDTILLVVALIHIAYLIKLGALKLSWQKPFESFKKHLEFQTYNLFLIISGGSMLIIENLDILMLGVFSGIEKAGIYSISFFIAAVIDMPRRAIQQISSPVLAESFKLKDFKKVDSIYKKTAINTFFAGVVLFLVIWINADNIFKIMPNGDIFKEAKIIILIIGFGRLFDISFGANSYILSLSKHYKINSLFITFLVLIAFSLNYFLIPKYGIEGAAYATTVSLVIFNLLKHWFVLKKFKLTPFTTDYHKLLIMSIVCLILNYFSPEFENPYLDVLIRTFSFALLFIILYIALKVKTDLVTKAISKINSINVFRK